MLRIVERVMGEGFVTSRDARLVDTAYTLNVYREWRPASGNMVPGPFVVEGHLHADADSLETLVGRGDLVLHLDDGRRLAFCLVSADGAVSSASEQGLEITPREPAG